jgi:adenylate cyclase
MGAAASERRLAAVLAADVVGYSRMMAADEAGTLARLRTARRDVVDPLMVEFKGRVFKVMGDGLLAEFPSAVQALRCAIAIQERLRDGDGLKVRIGLHQGDVIVEGGDLLGDGVNVAARLEAIAEPGGICISARVREDAAGKMPLDVEDIGTPPLKNIVQPVHVFRVRLDAPERPALALPDKPSIAVLPFQNMSGDSEQEYFADGIVEDITTAISRSSGLFVVARNSAFTYKGRAVDIRQVGRDLGVRYVLEGSIRKTANRVRITCQMIEAATGHHVWAERFDSEIADIFDLQDRITECVVGAIEPNVERAEIARAAAKRTESLDSYDHYLRALPQFRTMTRVGMDAAVALLRQALEIDPKNVRGKGLLAHVYLMRIDQKWGASADRNAAITLAREILATTTDDPEAIAYAGWSLAYSNDHQGALTALNRALRLHPNFALCLHCLGFAHLLGNDPEPAIGYFERAIRISPRDPEMGNRIAGLGVALFHLGRTDEAIRLLQRAVEEAPNVKWIHRHLIHKLVRLARHTEARAAAMRLLEIDPEHRVGSIGILGEEGRRALLSAGIPE